jgi:hypothetical protein
MTDVVFQTIARVLRSERRWGGGIAWLSMVRALLGSGAKLLIAAALFLLLAWWWGAFARLVGTAPDVRLMSTLSVTLTQDRPVRIGRDHLGQAYVPGSIASGTAAAPEHIELVLRVPDRNDATKDRVEIRNVATQRRLWLAFASGFETFAERFEIPYETKADTRFRIGNATIILRKVTPEGFELSTSERRADGTNVTAGPHKYRLQPTWRELWGLFYNGLPADAVDSDVVAAHLGGRSTDYSSHPMQIALSSVLDWEQLRLVYRDNRLFLAIGRDLDRTRYPIAMELIKPGDSPTSAPIQTMSGFGDIRWVIAPPPPARARSLTDRLKDIVFGPARDPQYEQVLRSFVAGRTSYGIGFAPRPPPVGRDPVQRTLHITPERKTMLQSVNDCVGSPPPQGCAIPIGPLHPQGNLECATTTDPALRQCWRRTKPLIDGGSAALFRAGSSSAVPLSVGPTAGLKEIAVTKWVTLLLALLLVITARPRGPSDRLFDGLQRGGPFRWLRAGAMRWVFALVSVGLALVPEIWAVLGSYNIGRLAAQPLGPEASFAVLVINWGIAGAALILFTPTAAITVGLAWIGISAVAAIGSLTLASLAIDGPSTHWASYFLKHKFIFLDSVPPVVTVVAVASRACIQRGIRSVLLERGAIVALARVAAPLMLALFFLSWIFVGSQTGVGGFQPIEAGKFVTVILIAAALVGLVSYSEDVRPRFGWIQRAFSLIAYGLFTALLFGAPVWRSDFSPVLIVLLLGATVGLLYMLLACLNVLIAAYRRRSARMRIPLSFRPAVNRGNVLGSWAPLWLRRWLAFATAPLRAVVTIALIVLMVVLSPVLIGWGAWKLLHVENWSETAASERIDELTKAMGQGRHVPAQRFITWYDTDLQRRDGARGSRAQFRDLEFHVIRSRTEVAYGDCKNGTKLFDPHAGWGRWFTRSIELGAARIAGLAGLRARLDELCTPFEPASQALDDEKEEVETGGREINEPVAPIEIPVAENDSTAAYLLARYGVGAGVSLYAAQVLLVLMALYGLIRIHFGQSNAMPDAHVRQFVGVMLAGSITLYVLQWSLSWSNVLGLLPFMGQPMTWLSAGNSHHFFMALPCLLVILTALRMTGRAPSVPRPRTPPRRT